MESDEYEAQTQSGNANNAVCIGQLQKEKVKVYIDEKYHHATDPSIRPKPKAEAAANGERGQIVCDERKWHNILFTCSRPQQQPIRIPMPSSRPQPRPRHRPQDRPR